MSTEAFQVDAEREWELDARVATALGWRFWLEQRGDYRLAVSQAPGRREPWFSSRNWQAEAPRYEETDAVTAVRTGFFGVEIPRFSTEIAAAWEVVEAMADRGLLFTLEIEDWRAAIRGVSRWNARFMGGLLTRGYGEGETAPLAICRAALAALSPNEEEK